MKIKFLSSSHHVIFSIYYFTNKETQAVYYTVVKHDRHLRTRGKCRKHELQPSVFYIKIMECLLPNYGYLGIVII